MKPVLKSSCVLVGTRFYSIADNNGIKEVFANGIKVKSTYHPIYGYI